MGNKIKMRDSVVLCSGACSYVFDGPGKGNYSDISKVCYPRFIKTVNRAHLR